MGRGGGREREREIFKTQRYRSSTGLVWNQSLLKLHNTYEKYSDTRGARERERGQRDRERGEELVDIAVVSL